MAIADLATVLSIFQEKQLNDDAKETLFKEVLLMTLARAASSDANLDPVELTTVQADYIGVPVEGPYKPEHYRY